MAKIILNVDLKSGSAEQELAKFKKSIQGLGDPKGVKNIDTLRKSYANLINTIQSSEKNYKKGTFSKIAEDAKKYLDEVKKLDPATSDYAKKSKQLDDELKRLQADFAETKTEATNFHGSLQDIVKGFMKFQIAATLVMKPLQLMKNAYEDLNETLVETEKRVVSLRRVAGDSANADELYKLAQKYGQTFDNVADVVENLVKSGYTWEESLKAAEPALLAINVAELDATQATEGLIAVVKQYGLELEDLNYIQGVLNKTADNAAVTTEKLLIALQKTGSTAKNANISFEETVGLITALSEGTAASGQNIGNALRSLIVFTSDSKALDKFAGLSSNMAETVKNYRAGQASILDIWQGLGGELQGMNSQKGTLEDLFGGAEMTADIEAQLTQITDSFAEIYGTAGNYRQNYFIALLDNIAKVEDATKDLSDATSYSQKENEKYLDTYEAKVNKLNEKWKELANDEQGFLAFRKGMVELGTLGLEGIEKVGGLRTVAIALGGALTTILVPAIQVTKVKLTELGITANASLGWISAAITAISVLTGLVSSYQQAQHEANQEAIQNWESIKSQTTELYKLYNQYKDLTPETKNYAEIEKELVTALGEKSVALEGLTKGTDDYREAVKKLAEEELRRAEQTYTLAQKAAGEELANFTFIHALANSAHEELGIYTGKTETVLKNAGVDVEKISVGGAIGLAGYDSSRTAKGNLSNYDLYVAAAEKVWDEYKKAILNGDDEYAEQVLEVYEGLVSQIEEAKPYIENYRNTSDSLDFILKELSGIEETTGEIDDNTSNIAKTLQNLDKTTLTNVVNKLKDARDSTKESYEYEEKRKAVLEAEEALRKAQESRTVRVYNAKTGRWEQVVNEKDVESARERLEEARFAVESAAYDTIIKDIESGNATSRSILNTLANFAYAYGTGDFSAIKNDILSILQSSGITINEPSGGGGGKPFTKVQLYDNGGVLYGLGGIKATSSAESVLDPDMTRKVLSPVSNKEFDTFVKDLGLLFGTASAYSQGTPIYHKNTSSDSHDSHYQINGVPIPTDIASRFTLSEIANQLSLIPS